MTDVLTDSAFEAHSVYERVVQVFFYNKPHEDLKKTIHKNFIGYGTAAHEFFQSREDVMGMAKSQSEQLSIQPHEIHGTPVLEKLFANGTSCLIVEVFEMHFWEPQHHLIVRLSVLLERIEGTWMVTHFHASTPDSNIAEDEAFPMEGLRKKNAELEAKIRERTRDLEVEASLERVRARAMAMQCSSELSDLVDTLFRELTSLDFALNWCIINVIDAPGLCNTVWAANPDTRKPPESYHMLFEDYPFHHAMMEGYLKREPKFIYTIEGDEKKSYDDYLFSDTEFRKVPREAQDVSRAMEKYVCSFSFSNFGGLQTVGEKPLSPENLDILHRFGKVFDLTYTRFLDLQKAEAQARASTIEAALERVRAKAMAMQQPEQLKEVAEVLRSEMGKLGVEELETSSIYIHHTNAQKIECWYALKDIRDNEKVLVTDHMTMDLKETAVGRDMMAFYESGENRESIIMKGNARKEWIAYCEKQSESLKGYYGKKIPDRTYHLYRFSHGALGAATTGDLSEESWGLLRRAASAFSLAYSRFKDLTQARLDLQHLKEEKKRAEEALNELRLTQSQLIQAEKMASLGELTAGIAHEIQNPLNFVNNFSEVSAELIDEMNEEIGKGDYEEVKAIGADLKENLSKINHHGKRADGIVKGMLQHSRASGGEKEPTDLNALADEYLRLAYHGLRAKDKSFNAAFSAELEPKLPRVMGVPQELGRVLLNLINNAFYAVDEKAKTTKKTYQPEVVVRTQTQEGSKGEKLVEISVSDNGEGIPETIKEKIFQPFFTTKPTGSGTGLGLSLSYDIVKAHAGVFDVETKEGEGTTFILRFKVK